MKLGDILENKSASNNNPNKKVIFLRQDSNSIYCLDHEGIALKDGE